MFEWLGDLGSKASGYIKENPDQFSIIADTMGQRINPTNTNVSAGLGTALGKSSLAQKATEAGKNSSNQMLQDIIKNLAGTSNMNQVSLTRDPKTNEIKIQTTSNEPGMTEVRTPGAEQGNIVGTRAPEAKGSGTMFDLLQDLGGGL